MRKIAYILLPVSFLAIGVIGYRFQQEHEARLAAERQISELQSQITALRSAPPPAPHEEREPVPDPHLSQAQPSGSQTPSVTAYIRAIDEARTALEMTRKELSSVRNDLAAAEGRARQEREERERLAAEVQDTREQIASERRAISALETELRSRNDRLAKVETSEKLLREAISKTEQTSTRALKAATELEELNRRRETLMASIVRRYRDVTDLYRTLSLRLQDRAGQQGFEQGAGELSRIQNSVQQAEEEFRQVNALNAQAARVMRGTTR